MSDPYFTPESEENVEYVSLTSRVFNIAAAFGVLTAAAAVLAFLYYAASYISWLIRNDYWWTGWGLAALLANAGTLLADTRWRNRLGFLLGTPAAVAGSYLGYRSFFGAMDWTWFEAFFNDKGTGPMGLGLFVCVGAYVGAFPVYFITVRTIDLVRPIRG